MVKERKIRLVMDNIFKNGGFVVSSYIAVLLREKGIYEVGKLPTVDDEWIKYFDMTLSSMQSGEMKARLEDDTHLDWYNDKNTKDIMLIALPRETKKGEGEKYRANQDEVEKINSLLQKQFGLGSDDINYISYDDKKALQFNNHYDNLEKAKTLYFDFLRKLFYGLGEHEKRDELYDYMKKVGLHIYRDDTVNTCHSQGNQIRLVNNRYSSLFHELTHYVHNCINDFYELFDFTEKFVPLKEGLANLFGNMLTPYIIKGIVPNTLTNGFLYNNYYHYLFQHLTLYKYKNFNEIYTFFEEDVAEKFPKKQEPIVRIARIFRFCPLEQENGIEALFRKELGYGVGINSIREETKRYGLHETILKRFFYNSTNKKVLGEG